MPSGMEFSEVPDGVLFSPMRAFVDEIIGKIEGAFRRDMWHLSKLGPLLLERLGQLASSDATEGRKDVNILLLNANTTTLAALELWRRGYPFQAGILLRNVAETLATAATINGDMDLYRAYKSGGFKSSTAFTTAKKVLPRIAHALAKADGDLSNAFTHLGPLYRSWQFVTLDLTERDMLPLRTMLLSIKMMFHLLDVLSELVCYDFVTAPRYWERVQPGAYRFAPSPEGHWWIAEFLGPHSAE